MDITLIALAIFILIAIVFLLLFLFKSLKKPDFKAKDGSVFKSQSELEVYQQLLVKLQPLLSFDEKGTSQLILGFEKSFLSRIKRDGFSDLKTLLKYRGQIKSLSDLINP